MNNQPFPSFGETIQNFATVFEAMPGNAALLKPDAPQYTILAVTDDFCRATGLVKQQLVGQSCFDAFPANPLQEDFTGDANMRTSLDKAMRTKRPDHLPLQRYDVPNADGMFTEKYWEVTNKPVLDEAEQVIYLLHTAVDITDRIKASRQKQIIEDLQTVENLLKQVPVAIHIFKGHELTIAAANETTLHQWSHGHEVIGKPLAEVLPETMGQGFDELLRNVMRTGQVQDFYEQPVTLNRNGKTETGYFNFSYRPFYEENDAEPTGVLVVGTEVTDKVVAKKELTEKNQRLELAVEMARLGDFKVDLATQTATYSQQAMEWFGLPGNEETLAVIGTKIHPDDREKVQQTFEQSVLGQADGRHDITYRVVGNDGSYRHIRSIGKVQFEDGKAVSVYGMLQDVTEQVLVTERIEQTVAERTEELRQAHASLSQANAYLQTIINLFQEPLQVLEPIVENGKIVDFCFRLTNAAYAAYANKHPEELSGKRVSEFFPGYFLTSSFTNVAQAFSSGKANTWEVHYDQDGLDLYNVMSAKKMDGNVIVHFTDVTKLKHLQLELQQKVTALERSNKQLEEFAHVASHDLKEPVRKIQVFIGQMKTTLAPALKDNEAKLFSRIEDAGRRMALLIDDLLLYSQTGQTSPQKANTDLNEKLTQVLDDLELDIQEKAAIIHAHPLPIVRGYQQQLQQLLQNLISNAIKYSKAGMPPQVEISSALTERDGKPYHLIQIQDNGIGFEQEHAEKIFGMFTRLHGRQEYSGTGIGLAIVKRVIENHDGFIEVTSRKDIGSAFKIYLPV